MVGVDDGPQAEDIFRSLLPFVGQRTDEGWASRWTVVLAEVERRGGMMGLASAVESVRDDLAAHRL